MLRNLREAELSSGYFVNTIGDVNVNIHSGR